MSTLPPVTLWQIGEIRCLLTPAASEPPYDVSIYKSEQQVVHRSFATHHAATHFAVESLRSYSYGHGPTQFSEP